MTLQFRPSRRPLARGGMPAVAGSAVIGLGGPVGWTVNAQSSPGGSSSGWSGYTIRTRIEAAGLSNIGGSQTRVTFAAGTGGNAVIGAAYIGNAASAGDTYDFEASPTQLLFSGGAGTTVTASTQTTSDGCAFTITAAKPILVAVQFSGATQIGFESIKANWSSFYKAAVSEAATVDVTGYSVEVNALFTCKIETFF